MIDQVLTPTLTQGGTPCPPCLFYLCRLCFGIGALHHIEEKPGHMVS